MHTKHNNVLPSFIHGWLNSWIQEWWPLLVGFFILYAPTYHHLMTTTWRNDDQAHGPIVLGVVLFLIWRNRACLASPQASETNITADKANLRIKQEANTSPSNSQFQWSAEHKVLGYLLITFGLFCYILGRSQDILLLDIGSQIPVFAGILLLTRGIKALKSMWFPLLFICFMIPLPGFFLDAVTLPMKLAVSYVTDTVLHFFNYPIARTGVVLQIGQYQLLVADACAGMHTLVSLEALGLLYLNLVRHDSIFRNITLAILIIPISFTANVVRVILLTLITYYFGDAAGQGFIHGFAGMALFIVALILIMSVDYLLQFFDKKRQGS